MALQGTLDTLTVPEVLRLLAATTKTGCLQIDGDRGRGTVWVANGALVSATTDSTASAVEISEVVFERLRYRDGRFQFTEDAERPYTEHDLQDLEATLVVATGLLEEWRQLEAVVPSPRCEVMLAPTLAEEQVTIDAERWATLARIGPGTDVVTLAHELALNELEVTRVVADLASRGLVDVLAEAASATRRRPTGETVLSGP